jgi:DNA-binding MarR family transcriptional regulator
VPSRTEKARVDQEAYNAIFATSKVMRQAVTGLFLEEGITEPQFMALGLLVSSGSMLMRKMSKDMLVTPANVTGIVDRLEEKKLAKRASVKGDRRATVVEITAEGRALYDRVALKKAAMVQKALATFTREELMTLRDLLERFQKEMAGSTRDR